MNLKYMELAYKNALKAYKLNEVPVGCVIVHDNKIIAQSYNKRETKQNALAHAEVIAINKACKKIGSWRLEDCDLYVTLEPCPMCAGAIIQSRIKNVYYGAKDLKTGACGSKFNLFDIKFNHEVNIFSGILEDKCGVLISNFFKELRTNK